MFSIEGAVVSNPVGDFVFRDGADVIRRRDLPREVAAVLSGHIHRHQVSPGEPPIVFPGSVERTSLVERAETKGFMVLDFDVSRGALSKWAFEALPTRPMILERLSAAVGLEQSVRAIIGRAPPDAVVHLRACASLRDAPALRLGQLRSAAPETMNVTVSFERQLDRRNLRRAACG